MERYADGDDAAFAELYDALAPALYGYLRKQTRDDAHAEDLLQQTLLQMHRARGHFIRGAAVLPWAYAIARRLLIDSVRRRKKEVVAEPPEQGGLFHHGEELLRAKQTAQALAAAVRRLPEVQRAAFELVRQEGLSLAEAADVLDTTVMAIKLRLHRADKAVKLALAQEPEAGEEGAA